MLDRIVGKKVVGTKQVFRALDSGKGTVLYVAKDADTKLINPLIDLASGSGIKIIEIETMKTLGKMCSVDVKSAAALVLE